MNDQSDTLSAVSCPNCGVSRPPELAHTATRPPCPECGETGIAISLGIVDEVNVGDELSVSMSPRDQKRGWRRRWAELQRDLERLDAPRTEQLSGEAVHAALHELQSFYVQAYHIKDAIRDEAPAQGVTIDQIEAAVANDPDLALR